MSSRKKQFTTLQSRAEEMAADMTALLEEVQEGLDNTPENFQSTEAYMANESRAEELGVWVGYLEEIVEYDWDNP